MICCRSAKGVRQATYISSRDSRAAGAFGAVGYIANITPATTNALPYPQCWLVFRGALHCRPYISQRACDQASKLSVLPAFPTSQHCRAHTRSSLPTRDSRAYYCGRGASECCCKGQIVAHAACWGCWARSGRACSRLETPCLVAETSAGLRSGHNFKSLIKRSTLSRKNLDESMEKILRGDSHETPVHQIHPYSFCEVRERERQRSVRVFWGPGHATTVKAWTKTGTLAEQDHETECGETSCFPKRQAYGSGTPSA